MAPGPPSRLRFVPTHRPWLAGTPQIELRWALAVFLATLAVYLALAPRVLRYTEPPTGDQPYYLQTAISLLEDHDLDERNNYRRGDYKQFYPADVDSPQFQGIDAPVPLSPLTHLATARNRPPTEWYSKHGVGLPLLILPGWALGERLAPLLQDLTASGLGGWPGVVLEMALLGALLATQVFLLVWQSTGVLWIALAVAVTLALANPQMAYSFLVFPEVPAALLAVYAFRRLILGWERNRPWQLALAGGSIALLPWLHARLLAIALPLAALGLSEAWHSYRGRPGAWHQGAASLTAFLAPLALTAVAFMSYQFFLSGSVLPSFQDHARFLNPWRAADWAVFATALLGLLFDQQWGLLIYAPVFVMVVAGCWVMWLRPDLRRPLLWLLAAVVPYGLMIASYRVWWGAWGPPARYLAPVTPLLALPLGQALLAGQRSRAFRMLYATLAILSIAVMAAMVAGLQPAEAGQPPAFFNFSSGHASLFQWLDARLGVDLAPYVPAIVPWFMDHQHPLPWPLMLGYLGLAAALAALTTILVTRRTGGRDRYGQKR